MWVPTHTRIPIIIHPTQSRHGRCIGVAYAEHTPITKSATRLIGENDVSAHSAGKIVLLHGRGRLLRVRRRRNGRANVVVTALSTARSAARQLHVGAGFSILCTFIMYDNNNNMYNVHACTHNVCKTTAQQRLDIRRVFFFPAAAQVVSRTRSIVSRTHRFSP